MYFIHYTFIFVIRENYKYKGPFWSTHFQLLNLFVIKYIQKLKTKQTSNLFKYLNRNKKVTFFWSNTTCSPFAVALRGDKPIFEIQPARIISFVGILKKLISPLLLLPELFLQCLTAHRTMFGNCYFAVVLLSNCHYIQPCV